MSSLGTAAASSLSGKGLVHSGCTPREPGLDAAVHLLAGAPGSFCIWEQEVPTGGKRVHLDGALERKDTDVQWQPAFVQNKNKISPA